MLEILEMDKARGAAWLNWYMSSLKLESLASASSAGLEPYRLVRGETAGAYGQLKLFVESVFSLSELFR